MSRPPGKPTALSVWCREKKGRQAWLAEKMLCDRSVLHRLSAGDMTPDIERALLIERWTEGAVPIVSWVDPERLRIRLRGIMPPPKERRKPRAPKAA